MDFSVRYKRLNRKRKPLSKTMTNIDKLFTSWYFNKPIWPLKISLKT